MIDNDIIDILKKNNYLFTVSEPEPDVCVFKIPSANSNHKELIYTINRKEGEMVLTADGSDYKMKIPEYVIRPFLAAEILNLCKLLNYDRSYIRYIDSMGNYVKELPISQPLSDEEVKRERLLIELWQKIVTKKYTHDEIIQIIREYDVLEGVEILLELKQES